MIFLFSIGVNAQIENPLKVGVVGLSHSHVHWLLSGDFKEVKIVGIVEPNKDLAKRLMDQYKLSMDLVYNNIEEMAKNTSPEAVTAFGSIYDHLEVVEKCAPLGIHVMVEKPLAVSLEHALKMRDLAKKYGIYLLTNYETTWYASNHKAYDMVKEKNIGDLRKIIVNDGHEGPIEIRVNQEFLNWLLDPKLNGGGAIMDFGCYGANLITWLMKGERPISVRAITKQIKPDLYPNVDDDATIILEYPKAQGLIQASWNWPFSRKDMEVYGQSGYLIAADATSLRTKLQRNTPEETMIMEPRSGLLSNPFSYFWAVVRGEIKMTKFEPTSIENNVIVMEILDAARESAEKSKTIYLK